MLAKPVLSQLSYTPPTSKYMILIDFLEDDLGDKMADRPATPI